MNSLRILAVTGALVAVFALAGCESHSSSSTSVEVSTSTESGTKTYSSSTQTKDGVTTSKETTVETKNDAAKSTETAAESKSSAATSTETPAASEQQDGFDRYEFHVNDADGTLTIRQPYSAEKWWKCIGNTKNIEVVEEAVEDGNVSVVTVRPTIESGQAEVIMAHFEADKEDAVDYMIFEVDVVGSKINIVKTEPYKVNDLESIFSNIEITSK